VARGGRGEAWVRRGRKECERRGMGRKERRMSV